jgi:hypothetical protein
VSFTPRPLYPRGYNPLYQLHRRLGGTKRQSGTITNKTGKKWFHSILQLITCTDFHGLGLLATLVAYNFHLTFYLSFRSVHALSQFYFSLFLLSPFDKA